jgi:D-alanyl-D-alanine carboxypeptidase
VTTRHETRPGKKVRSRRAAAAAVAVVLAGGLAVAGTPAPAQAAVPVVAQTWSALMHRSLTANATIAQLRATLATEQTAVRTRLAGVTTARTANDTAQARLTAATTADAAARDAHAAAVRARAAAKNTLSRVSKQKPRDNAAITRATSAVAVATGAVNARAKQAQRAATVRSETRTRAVAAATALTTAIAASQAASAAVVQTQQRIAGVGTAAGLAGQAAAVSRDVVTQVRAGFTIADTTTVYGITVHKNMAYAFKRMLDDAKVAGIVLSGGGFRTKERQIELRKINGCPDIWTAPASSCRVPTAIPGRSLHEIGLAVDITSGGKSLTAKSPGFTWLAAHADEYGYVNFPAEPWHWSITGN